jgi:hypothetical protein
MDEERMHRLVFEVKATAIAISRELGWRGASGANLGDPSSDASPKRA